MSRVYSDTVLPEDSGVSQDLTLGTTNDTVQVTSGATLKVNTLKDAGGNTIFTSNGSGVLSSINTAFSGGPTLLDTNTFTGASSSAFTSYIDNTYKMYIFSFNDMNPATNNTYMAFQVSINGGSSYGVNLTSTAFWASHNEANTNAELIYDNTGNYDRSEESTYQPITHSIQNDADASMVGNLYLFNPSGTVFVKHWSCTTNTMGSGYTINTYTGGYFNTTSAIDAIDFKMWAGNMDGEIKLYGL